MKPKYAAKLMSGFDIKDVDECWVWKKAKTKGGYGQMSIRRPELPRRRPEYTHRLMFELVHSYEPDEVMHTCDNPPCGNPNHLRDATHQENMQDSSRKGRAKNDQTNPERDRRVVSAYLDGERPSDIAEREGFNNGSAVIRIVKRYHPDLPGKIRKYGRWATQEERRIAIEIQQVR